MHVYKNNIKLNQLLSRMNYNKGSYKYNPYTKFQMTDILTYSNTDNLRKFLDSYQYLEIDPYLPSNYPPKRLRAYSKYNVYIKGNHYYIKYNSETAFKQSVDDSRKEMRIFQPIKTKYIYCNFMLEILQNMITLVHHYNPCVEKLTIHMHQVRNITYPNDISTNSPEGIHRDGADYIVSALVLNRHNIKHGTSIIMDRNKKELLSVILNTNEGIFQEDRELYHTVEPFECINTNYLGYRDILGLDITIDSYKVDCEN